MTMGQATTKLETARIEFKACKTAMVELRDKQDVLRDQLLKLDDEETALKLRQNKAQRELLEAAAE